MIAQGATDETGGGEGGSPRPLVIGVLGGMGPAATAHFQTRLVELSGATADRDHPTVVTWSDPTVPDRVAALRGTGPSPVPALRAGVDVLTGAGAQVLAVPCNTVHPFLPETLARVGGIRWVDMIKAAADEVAASGIAQTAVLATAATLEHGMYHRALADRGVRAYTPGPQVQSAVLELIAAVKAGVPVRSLVADYEHLVAELAADGCDGALVACSEISAVAASSRSAAAVRTVDAVDALARGALRSAGLSP